MTKRFWVGLAVLLFIPGLMFASSCARRVVESEPAVTPAEEEAVAKPSPDEEALAAQRALREQRLQEQRMRERATARRQREDLAERQAFLNEHVHFEFDKSRLLPEAKEVLRRKAGWLKANGDVLVIVEGHCDERGTNEYNMALGDRRAHSAKSYLVDLGIAGRRLTTISYGEEKPLARGHNEDAWSKNRRAQFVVE